MERIEIDGKSAILGALCGTAAGGVLGYLLCRRSLRRSAEARIEAEVQSVKDHYQNRAEAAAASSGDSVERVPAVGREGPVDEPESVDDRLEGVEGGDGDEADDGSDDQEPVARQLPVPVEQDGGSPYAISLDDFADQNEGWQQLTITYYALDDVLVDDKDQPIRDVLGTTGHLDALGFGGISEDPHIRFVRNPKLELDFEIVLDARSYADVILNYGNPNRGDRE